MRLVLQHGFLIYHRMKKKVHWGLLRQHDSEGTYIVQHNSGHPGDSHATDAAIFCVATGIVM